MSSKDLLKEIAFGQNFEYDSFENKTEIGKGRFGVMYKAYLKDIKQTVALKTLYYYDENSIGDLIKKLQPVYKNLFKRFEYASLENKTEIGKGEFEIIYKAYLKDIKQTVALETLDYDDDDLLDNFIRDVSLKGDRETPIEGTPVDFKNLYCAAWNSKPDSCPDIKEICKKLDHIQLELFCKDLFKKLTFRQKFEYTSFEDKKKIGKGGFGVIYKAYLKDINQTVALKTLDHDDENSLNDFIKEVKCITKVEHDNVIRFIGITQGMLIL
ncbi:6049_t:CDS:2 [Scutellospora calospora]|uniref:6049_t:CDS:1 n=1 Tax=Scutellospora calospora TaxID=85575 RepID=A0ACA9KKV3_9GLOM|nr:6049_t:CDS:2 [Scutellospora calospora]